MRASNRRIFLMWCGTAAAAPLVPTPLLAADAPPTPKLTEGPFYPRTFPADIDADLTRIEGHAATAAGAVLDVAGRVVDRGGNPVAKAKLEIWQCDNTGRYHHVGEPEGDPHFQGYGVAACDAEGRYRFRTIKPVPYPGRTPHIHFRVRYDDHARLTSQMFVEGDPRNEGDFLYRSLGADARLVTLRLDDAPAGSGAKLAGTLDIVLA